MTPVSLKESHLPYFEPQIMPTPTFVDSCRNMYSFPLTKKVFSYETSSKFLEKLFYRVSLVATLPLAFLSDVCVGNLFYYCKKNNAILHQNEVSLEKFSHSVEEYSRWAHSKRHSSSVERTLQSANRTLYAMKFVLLLEKWIFPITRPLIDIIVPQFLHHSLGSLGHNIDSLSKKQQYLVVVSAIALAIIFTHGAFVGCLFGIFDATFKIIFGESWNVLKQLKDKDTEWKNRPSFMVGCFAIPVMEEITFRVALQPALAFLSKPVLPARIVSFSLGAALPGATIISILATSVLFGLIHMGNAGHPQKGMQSILAVGSGLLFGYLKVRYGIFASITAHMTINSSIYLYNDITSQPKVKRIQKLFFQKFLTTAFCLQNSF